MDDKPLILWNIGGAKGRATRAGMSALFLFLLDFSALLPRRSARNVTGFVPGLETVKNPGCPVAGRSGRGQPGGARRG
ncbi:hypothetical protein, partial [Paracoccus luteus]|uniref:hypothetical protein n=1 Tax=Paracoccus luteus TaxID=2508543 RepID=UPI001C6FD7D2